MTSPRIAMPTELEINDRAAGWMLDEFCFPAKSRHELSSRLTGAIDNGRISVGEKIPTERQIAEHSGLSRTIVRSVLSELERAGRIVREVGRGTFVSIPERKTTASSVTLSPADIMEMRMVIEPSIAGLVVYKLIQRDIEALRAVLDEGDRVKKWEDAEHCDASFHDLIYRAARNEGIAAIADILLDARRHGDWLRLKESSFSPTRWNTFQKEHRFILDRMAARDVTGTRQAMVDHLSDVQIKML